MFSFFFLSLEKTWAFPVFPPSRALRYFSYFFRFPISSFCFPPPPWALDGSRALDDFAPPPGFPCFRPFLSSCTDRHFSSGIELSIFCFHHFGSSFLWRFWGLASCLRLPPCSSSFCLLCFLLLPFFRQFFTEVKLISLPPLHRVSGPFWSAANLWGPPVPEDGPSGFNCSFPAIAGLLFYFFFSIFGGTRRRLPTCCPLFPPFNFTRLPPNLRNMVPVPVNLSSTLFFGLKSPTFLFFFQREPVARLPFFVPFATPQFFFSYISIVPRFPESDVGFILSCRVVHPWSTFFARALSKGSWCVFSLCFFKVFFFCGAPTACFLPPMFFEPSGSVLLKGHYTSLFVFPRTRGACISLRLCVLFPLQAHLESPGRTLFFVTLLGVLVFP